MLCSGVQEQGYDTVDANRELGLPDDAREYTSVQNILDDLDIRSIRLMVRHKPFGESIHPCFHSRGYLTVGKEL